MSVVHQAYNELKQEKVIVIYADIFARSFKYSLISLWKHKEEAKHQNIVNDLYNFPITWSNHYYDDKSQYSLSMSSIINPYTAIAKVRKNPLLYEAELLTPRQILSNNWTIPTNRWDVTKQKWVFEEKDFLLSL